MSIAAVPEPDLPCFHWVRQSEERCDLGDDALFECTWDPAVGYCQQTAQQPSCLAAAAPACEPDTCTYDPYFQKCVDASVCQCTRTGVSGNVTLPSEVSAGGLLFYKNV